MVKPVKGKVDAFHITLKLTTSEYKAVLKELESAGYGKNYDTRKLNFDHGFSIELENALSDVRIYLRNSDPVKKLKPAVMIRLNPAFLSIQGAIELRDKLKGILGKAFKRFWKEGIVRKLDYCIDYWGLIIDEFFFTKSRARVSAIYLGPDGETQSVYLGSRPPTVFYNKVEEMAAKSRRQSSHSRSKLIDVKVLKGALARFESRIIPKTSLCDLYEMETTAHFDGVEVYSVQALRKHNEISLEFIDSCHRRGLHAALKRIEPSRRKRLKKTMECCKIELEDLHDSEIFQEALQAIVLVFCPEKQLSDFLQEFDDDDPELRYIHTGIISEHFLELALAGRTKLNKAQRKALNFRQPKDGKWKSALLGTPVTASEAAKVLSLTKTPV